MYTQKSPPFHQWQINTPDQLPLAQQKRKITDVCCIILGVLFGLILFIIACILYSGGNLDRTKYPTDSKGVICVTQAIKNGVAYPFLYFNDPLNPINDRHCVQECPQAGIVTRCYDDCVVNYYDNYPSSTDLGTYCLPNNPTLKNNILYQSGISKHYNLVKAQDYLLIGLGISFGLSLIWLLIVCLLPRFAVWVALILAVVLLLITGIVFLVASGSVLMDGQGWAISIGIFCIILIILLVLHVLWSRKQMQLCGIFLQIAKHYLQFYLSCLIYVPIFVGITFLFGLLLMFQYFAFSSSTPTLTDGSIFYRTSYNPFGIFLLVIQALWGLSFFRDMFNYIISGKVCDWYFHRPIDCLHPLKRLFSRNLGSVAGGSFLSFWLYIPGLLVSLFASRVDCTCCNFLDMCRSDAYSWINLSGNSYCPSSRQTHYLCRRSSVCRQNQSILTVYKFCARIFLSLSAVLIVYWISRDNLTQSRIPPYTLVGIFFACLYITSYCSDLHSIIAQAFTVCFLTQCELEEHWDFVNMKYCPDEVKYLVKQIQSSSGGLLRS